MENLSNNILEALLHHEGLNLIHNALFRTLEPGFFFGPHCHENIEFCLMQEGECDIIVNGECVTVGKNEFMVLFPNVIHSFRVSADKPCFFLQLHFKSENFFNLSSETYRHLKFLYDIKMGTKQYIKAIFSKQLFSCVERISEELNQDEINSKVLANLYIYELILLLSREIQQSFCEILNVDNKIALEAMRYINENINTKISLDEIAEHCNVSIRYLTKLFKDSVKVTVSDYITMIKIKKAMEYIQEGKESITEIAYKMGFSSAQYFSNVFRKCAGASPKEFRDYNKRDN